ncbi:hypothetical protein [Sphingobacterium multivorum]|nr:hypothetical protein [Sphingobacterium multivorum]
MKRRPIAANVVIGIEIFSDIGASYVDLFGGRATSYEVPHPSSCI